MPMTHDQIEMVLSLNGFVKKGIAGHTNLKVHLNTPIPCFVRGWHRRHPKSNKPQCIYILEPDFSAWHLAQANTHIRNHRQAHACKHNEKLLRSRNLNIPDDYLNVMDLCP